MIPLDKWIQMAHSYEKKKHIGNLAASFCTCAIPGMTKQRSGATLKNLAMFLFLFKNIPQNTVTIMYE